MHRPPAPGDPIRLSGPALRQFCPDQAGHANNNRRYSVVSAAAAGSVSGFPLKGGGLGETVRRPSDIWQGENNLGYVGV